MKKCILCFLMLIFVISLIGCGNGGRKQSCNNCGGTGKIECYKCGGLGQYYNTPLGNWYKCGICMGKGYRNCGECDN